MSNFASLKAEWPVVRHILLCPLKGLSSSFKLEWLYKIFGSKLVAQLQLYILISSGTSGAVD